MKTLHSKSSLHIVTLASLLISLIGGAVFVTPAQAATLTVTAGATDLIANNSSCSLREAIINANNDNQSGSTDCLAGSGDDTISVPAGTYTLAIPGTGEYFATTGDLNITSNITINGAGPTSTIIQSGTKGVGGPPNGIDRVFHVTGAFTVNISGVTIRNGNANLTSDNGGGIFNNGGTLTITNSIISGNSANLYGGGIEDESGTLTITNSTISGNDVNSQGGGFFTHFGTLTITNSTFSGNNADDAGGGIFNSGGTATITNSTFSSNSAPEGGAILGYGTAGTLIITNSTFSGNSATYGGGIRVAAGTATLRNTIVANNTGGNCSGTITNGGNNIDDGTTCDWGSASGSKSSTNPLLGALANNGGPTQTFALLTGSSAIDAGNDTVCNADPVNRLDQRGIARPQGAHCDIGSYEFVDTTPPNTTIDSHPSDPSNDNTPTFAFSGDDGTGSGIASFMCRMDGGGYSACTTPFTSSALLDGSHTFYVYAIDNTGNADASPASFTWQVDTTPPNTTIDSHPSDPSNDNTPTFAFSGDDGTGSGIASFMCQMDSGGYSACSSPFTSSALADGPHTFDVYGNDMFGNADASPASHTWTLDTVAPDTTIINKPASPDNDSTPTFTFSGSDGMGSGIASFMCQMDSVGYSACTTPFTSLALLDGSHTFYVYAIDNAGNPDASSASFTWQVMRLYRIYLPLIMR